MTDRPAATTIAGTTTATAQPVLAPTSRDWKMDIDSLPAPVRRRSIWRRLGPAGALGAVWAFAPAIGGFVLLSQIGPISEWLDVLEMSGVSIYVAAFVIAAGFGLLPTYSQAVLAGWVFGVVIGFPAALAGFTGAALLGYAITRLVAHHRVEEVMRENPKAWAIRNALVGRGFGRTLGIVTLIRIPPNSPFSLTNLALAGSGVGLAPYALGTLIGMAPRTFVAVFFAAGAAATGARDIQAFIKGGPGLLILIIGVILMFVVLGVIGAIANRAIERIVSPTTGATANDGRVTRHDCAGL